MILILFSQFLGTPSALYCPKPADGGEPQLSASELEQIDARAEDLVVNNRHVQMGVLAPLDDDDPPICACEVPNHVETRLTLQILSTMSFSSDAVDWSDVSPAGLNQTENN